MATELDQTQAEARPRTFPRIVSRAQWLAARKDLLAKEKEATRVRDAVNADRRRLPMVAIDKDYVFEGPDGETSLLELFEGRRQLVMHHFMWLWDFTDDGREVPRDVGCPSCSWTADDISHLSHLHAANTSLVAVSRAPLAKIAPFKARMGWTFPWYSSHGSDFNYDFHATVDDTVAPVLLNLRDERELEQAGMPWSAERRGDYPGVSAFLRDGDTVFHTYSAFARGIEHAGGTAYYLDLTALGRQEPWEEPADRRTGDTPELRYHDEYPPGT